MAPGSRHVIGRPAAAYSIYSQQRLTEGYVSLGFRVHVGLVRQKQLHNFLETMVGRAEQRGPAIPIPGVDLGLIGQEQFDYAAKGNVYLRKAGAVIVVKQGRGGLVKTANVSFHTG